MYPISATILYANSGNSTEKTAALPTGRANKRITGAKRTIKRTMIDSQYKLIRWLVTKHGVAVVKHLHLKSVPETSQDATNEQDAA